MSATPPSLFQSSLTPELKLERARLELLDLSARNRLLNVPKFSKTAKTVDVVGEKTAEVFRLLVRESKSFSFVAGRPDRPERGEAQEGEGTDEEGQWSAEYDVTPEDAELDARGVMRRHADTRLQTRMTPKGLQKRLLDMYHDARTLEEEQGVNILFLALGTLKWIDPKNKDNARHAPLLLVPVTLDRAKAGERFTLRARQEEITSNLSLEAWLDREHGLAMPAFDATDDFDPVAYLAAVSQAVSTKAGWQVESDDIVLGFFSFAKFLMYRDLDPANWPDQGILHQPVVRSLLGEGFESDGESVSDDVAIDDLIPPADMLHIVDADSSQTLAIHDVRKGRNLVIQGPPGTGKSQTIANVIAAAVADGKTVLFVAEKMAALEVVKRRLDSAGVGDACLELHSNKANKRALLQELRRTWELGAPRADFPSNVVTRLQAARDGLNGHVTRMHTALEPSVLSPFDVVGQMVRLRREGQRPVDLQLEGATTWTPDDVRDRARLVHELSQRIDDIGRPAAHPWYGIGLDMVLPTYVERLTPRLQDLADRMARLQDNVHALATALALAPAVASFDDVTRLTDKAERLATVPGFLSADALASPVWDDRLADIRAMLDQGLAYAEQETALRTLLQPDAITRTDLQRLQNGLAALPADFPLSAIGAARDLLAWLPRLTLDAQRLAAELGSTTTTDTFAAIARLATTAERVANAPDASPEAFAATVWSHGVEQANDLAQAVATLEHSRAAIGEQLLESAWTADVAAARQALATHTGMFKMLNGDWRKARALARSLVCDPQLPVADIVALFDVLLRGQAAAARIRADHSFGLSAFGGDWRGERSTSAPLLALVEWMRTLQGLGDEPRLLAGRLAERSAVGARAAQLRQLIEQARPAMQQLGQAYATNVADAFDGAATLDHASLAVVGQRAAALVQTDDLARQWFVDPPLDLNARMAQVDQLAALHAAHAAVAAHAELGAAAFDGAWLAQASDWPQLISGYDWITAHGDLRHVAAAQPDRKELVGRAKQQEAAAAALADALDAMLAELNAEPAVVWKAPQSRHAALDSVSAKLASWLANTEQLSKWVAYRERADTARKAGLASLADRLADGGLAPNEAGTTFDMAYHEAILGEMIAQAPELGRFDGALHSRHVQEFANLDRERIAGARIQVASAHYRRIPPRDGGIGAVGVLRAEMAKRRAHLPIRQLVLKAGPAIQAIKPVMMMSPLSVAQFLSPGSLTFDLLVMDEASQIQPVDAMGAIARCRQVVVVGDERQLPPTKFFSKITESQADDEDDDTQVSDIESILGLFTARGLPQRMLRWHYRSRHQSLIAISNTQFYENKLYIVPSPYTQEAGMGLRFHHVPDGVFDSGGTGANLIEAKVVAAAILAHAQQSPELSLGVATFSVSQRKAITDELEALRRAHPATEGFFGAHPSEPFFVKNLENVQGDERDVIMISVGHARNTQGNLTMRFGPLGAEGGERRLNVLISRAKRRCEVFASITDEDIDLERAKGKGVFAFKLFLHYARTGRLDLGQNTARDAQHVFEAQVATALQAKGYQVHPRVGIAGIFIDLAVADPAYPGRYLLGIECDGTAYRSARSARDRDRLRQSVLEDHGWRVHRIWSVDWFQRPQEQLDRVVAAIEAAKAELADDAARRASAAGQQGQASGQPAGARRAVPVEIVTVDRGDMTAIGLVDSLDATSPDAFYVEATLDRPGAYELHDTPARVMADLVRQVVAVESPVHIDEVIVRIRGAWGLQRAGARIEAAVGQGVQLAMADGAIERDGDFLLQPGKAPVLRDRRNALSAGLRKPEMIAPAEIAAGIVQVVGDHLGAADEEIVVAVAQLLGFKSTSAPLRKLLAAGIDDLLANGTLTRRNALIVMRDQAAA